VTAVSSGTQATLAPTLGGRYYTDPAVLDAECERIFERQWYYAGRADEIPEHGRFIRRRVGRETVLLVRGKDQVIRGFLNVCRHRGSQLCLTGSGSVGNAIHCPYHNWIYGLDGSLITTPNWRAMTEISKKDYGLHSVKAASRWPDLVCIDSDQPAGGRPPADRVAAGGTPAGRSDRRAGRPGR
jgi:Rieske 2Fe-2S family protein